MKPDDFIAGWTRARKLYLLYMGVIISALACAAREAKQKIDCTFGLLQAPVQQCFFVLGQVNIGTLTMNMKHKTWTFLAVYACQWHFKADLRVERPRVRQLAHVQAPWPKPEPALDVWHEKP